MPFSSHRSGSAEARSASQCCWSYRQGPARSQLCSGGVDGAQRRGDRGGGFTARFCCGIWIGTCKHFRLLSNFERAAPLHFIPSPKGIFIFKEERKSL